ncbi:MAG: DNA-3-methyladenine glycosylase, partial [Chloroflexi bacterium]|nr:DNA-3-methyladenine glycosylase [Chloroflexota bacterium]
MTRLSLDYFARDTVDVAQDLLGCILVHQVGETRVAGRVVETEAYSGWDDLASHGRAGRTERNLPMFGPVAVSYVYLIYGMYWLLNVVAKPPDADYPAAVLIRALEPVDGLEFMAAQREGRRQREWTSGPGRLTLALGIAKGLNGISMVEPDSPLFFEAGAGPAVIATG